MSTKEIVEMAADRNTIEQMFKDLKQEWGAGEQQARKLQTNIGAWHMNLWGYTLVECWAWEQSNEQLIDRQDSPWDDGSRRPSRGDRRKALLEQTMQREIEAAEAEGPSEGKWRALLRKLLCVAV
jgi:hypothetical protein